MLLLIYYNYVVCYGEHYIEISLFLFQYGDWGAHELWTQLLPKLPSFFTGITVRPALLHGDLWSGNAAQEQVCMYVSICSGSMDMIGQSHTSSLVLSLNLVRLSIHLI